jgi:hypothetical protein
LLPALICLLDSMCLFLFVYLMSFVWYFFCFNCRRPGRPGRKARRQNCWKWSKKCRTAVSPRLRARSRAPWPSQNKKSLKWENRSLGVLSVDSFRQQAQVKARTGCVSVARFAHQTAKCAITPRTRTRPRTMARLTRSRGLGWRIHGSVEDTKLSTNKQHSLSAACVQESRARFSFPGR